MFKSLKLGRTASREEAAQNSAQLRTINVTQKKAKCARRECTLTKREEGFIEACAAGDLRLIRSFVKEEVDVGVVDLLGYTGLGANVAGAARCVHCVRELLSAGCDPSHPDLGGMSPLHFAAAFGDPAICQELVAGGASLMAKTVNGDTPLHLSVSGTNSDGAVAVAEVLIEAGAKIGSRNMMRNQPLHVAAGSGCVAIVALLLNAGANTEARNRDGLIPEDLSPTNEVRAAIEKTRIENAAMNAQKAKIETKVLHACTNGDAAACKEALDESVVTSLGATTEEGDHPLHLACRSGHCDCVKLLVKMGSDPEQLNARQQSPLAIAAGGGFYGACKVLLSHGASLGTSLGASSPASLAAQGGHRRVVRLLRERADRDATNSLVLFYMAVARRRVIDLFFSLIPPCGTKAALAHWENGTNSQQCAHHEEEY